MNNQTFLEKLTVKFCEFMKPHKELNAKYELLLTLPYQEKLKYINDNLIPYEYCLFGVLELWIKEHKINMNKMIKSN